MPPTTRCTCRRWTGCWLIKRAGLLFVGDCKMSALATRAHIAHLQQRDLCPMALTGETPQNVAAGLQRPTQNTPVAVYTQEPSGERQLMAEGYTFERTRPEWLRLSRPGPNSAWSCGRERDRQVMLAGRNGACSVPRAQLLALTPCPPAANAKSRRRPR